MGGGDLNSKKSWHPNTIKNQERVWKAEQSVAEERKRIAELQKERAEERDREELNALAKSNKMVGNSDSEVRLSWMYDMPDKKAQSEDYLLGKSVDSKFDGPPREEGIPSVSRRVAGASMMGGTDVQVDLARKLREDPLLLVQERERAARAALLNNPVQRKKLTELLRKDQEKKKEKSKNSKSTDIDNLLASKLNALGGQNIDLAALLASDDSSSDSSDESSGKKKKKKKSKKKKSKKSKKAKHREEDSSDSEYKSTKPSKGKIYEDAQSHKKRKDKTSDVKNKNVFDSRDARRTDHNRYRSPKRIDTRSPSPKYRDRRDERVMLVKHRKEDSSDSECKSKKPKSKNKKLQNKADISNSKDDRQTAHKSPKRTEYRDWRDERVILAKHRKEDSSDSEHESKKLSSKNKKMPDKADILNSKDARQTDHNRHRSPQRPKFSERRQSPSKDFSRKRISQPQSSKEQTISSKKSRLSSAERNARLAEMMAAGIENEAKRGKRVTAQLAELENDSLSSRLARPSYAHGQMLPDSLEARIHSNRHNIQRSKTHMNEHFARR